MCILVPDERYETDAGCMGKTWYSGRSFCGNGHGIRYPKFEYARGAQKSGKQAIHHLKF